MGSPLLVLAIIVVLLVVLVATSIRVVAANERLVVFRMGRVDPSGVHGPGRTLLLPIIDRAISVSLEPPPWRWGCSSSASPGCLPGVRSASSSGSSSA